MNEKAITFIKLVCIIYLIYFLPHIISKHSNTVIEKKKSTNLERSSFKVLLQNKDFKWIKGLRLAVISDKKTTNNSIKNNIKKLQDNKFNIKKIFIPTKLPGHTNLILSSIDEQTDTQIYKWNKKYEKIPAIELKNIDALVFDMKNSGIKQGKSFRTLIKAAKIAAENNKELIVMDKPNPLGPYIEGAGTIPIRYGLTIGEIASYINKFHLQKKANLTIVPIENWERNNIKYAKKQAFGDSSREKALLKILSMVKPINKYFKSSQKKYALLLPYDQNMSMWEQEYFKKLCLKSGLFSNDYSIITKSKKLNGIRIKLRKDFHDFSIYNTFLSIIRFLNNRENINLTYKPESFDSLSLIPLTKEFLDRKVSFSDLKKETENSLIKFYTKARCCLQYSPDPKIIPVKLIKA